MNYPDSVRFLYSLGNEIKTAKLGLDRIRRLSVELGNPHRRPRRFIHVAGTNGKGSVCAMIESGLRANGIRTGLFTSPHLLEPTERMRINGVPATAAEFAAAFHQVHHTAEALLADGEIDMHPTYFETVTAMALLYFRQQGVECAVMETGLGGRLDATNIVEPELCVITSIDFDHEKFLGHTIEQIAAEKAGILKPDTPVILGKQHQAAASSVVRESAAQLGVEVLDAWVASHVDATPEGNAIEAGNVRLETGLAGRHQVENALNAATALQHLSIPLASIQRGLRETRWPGRLQRVQTNPEIIVDGAHNPAGVRALATYVQEFYASRNPVLIFGAMRDKAVEEMAGLLFPLFHQVIATAPRDQDRALSPETFLNLTDHPDVRTAPDLAGALHSVKGLPAPVFIAGSLFLVAEALQLFS